MKDRKMEERTAKVPIAKQAVEAKPKWVWAEPSIWNERMLTALETGVKGGKWFSLIDKIHRAKSLESAFERVKANKGSAGVDHVSVEEYAKKKEENLQKLKRELEQDTYEPQAIRRVWIPKLGSKEMRPLGVPTVRDRVVQTAVRNAMEPIFEKDFADGSYGFRPGRSGKDALREVDKLLKEGHRWVVDADLKSYFDTIPHEPLMERIEEKISDGRVLRLIKKFLKQGILETMKAWVPTGGTPQGAVISPLLSNVYLDPLDHEMARAGYRMIRYADDFVILCKSKEEAEKAMAEVKTWCDQAGLSLHPDKTRIVDATLKGGFDFLGYHFERNYRWPRKKSIQKLKDALRSKTPRKNGRSMQAIIVDINRTLKGWFEYFRHSNKTTYPELDGWIRRRLRSILRKRSKRKGISRGHDHFRWPNEYFAKHGLFSLTAAYASLLNPRKR